MDLSLEAIRLPVWDPSSAAEWDEAFEKVENYLRACRVASRLHRARLTAVILQRAIERRAAGGHALENRDSQSAVGEPGIAGNAPQAAALRSAPSAGDQTPAALPLALPLELHPSPLGPLPTKHVHLPASEPVPLATLAIEEARELVAHWLANLLPSRSEEQPFTLAEGFLALYLCDAPMRWPGAFLNPQQAPPDFADTLRSRIVKTGPELEVSSMVPRQIDLGLLPDLAESAFDTLDRFPLIKTLLVWTLFVAGLVFLFWYTRR